MHLNEASAVAQLMTHTRCTFHLSTRTESTVTSGKRFACGYWRLTIKEGNFYLAAARAVTDGREARNKPEGDGVCYLYSLYNGDGYGGEKKYKMRASDGWISPGAPTPEL